MSNLGTSDAAAASWDINRVRGEGGFMVGLHVPSLVCLAAIGISGCILEIGEDGERTGAAAQTLATPTVVNISSSDFAYGEDYPQDGTFDWIAQGDMGTVYHFQVETSWTDARTGFEFALPSFPTGYWIESASLSLNMINFSQIRTIAVCPYDGDGTVTTADLVAMDAACENAEVYPIGWQTLTLGFTEQFARNFVPRSVSYVGFNVSEYYSPIRLIMGLDGGAYGAPPSLSVSYVVDKFISIDIKPGSSGNPINFWARGTIPVAILSSTDFNAGDVDPATPTFGRYGGEASLMHCDRHLEDVNGDSLPDMVCQFSFGDTQLKRSSRTGTLRAQTYAGDTVRGTDQVRMIY